MADTTDDAVPSKADVLALAAEAEAEAAEAEALAAAARAKARAARLRREALAAADRDDDDDDQVDDDEYDEYDDEVEDDDEYEYEYQDYDDSDEYEPAEEYEAEDYDESTNYSDSDQAAEPALAAEPTRRQRLRRAIRKPKLSSVAAVVAVLLTIGFTAFSILCVWWHHQATDKQRREEAFIAGAKQGVVNMTSLDFNRAKQDVQRVIDSSTGEFRDDFQQRATDFTKVVEQSKVVTEGSVSAAAIESIEGSTARVLISATSRVTNSAGAKNEPRTWRLRVTVTEEDGQYKMSKVEFVP
ncbi:hypothetical protein [Mycobacterium vicinigordonae]|uniref:Mce protein n=1 Tax=Mycobacterium vicinigordonae TaxID=1719132 RepID=A0A7D6DWW7_9MYCO|nr:hypothetical protein [Mycobacterium vicinigordonae]QLL06029.1 hypothetical protein H0P51_19905 [Mycobacterium vicinigordonae]